MRSGSAECVIGRTASARIRNPNQKKYKAKAIFLNKDFLYSNSETLWRSGGKN
jgi:hypothetical protein